MSRSEEFNVGTVVEDGAGNVRNAQDSAGWQESLAYGMNRPSAIHRVGRPARKDDPIDQDRSHKVQSVKKRIKKGEQVAGVRQVGIPHR